jgi:hypothetical protein
MVKEHTAAIRNLIATDVRNISSVKSFWRSYFDFGVPELTPLPWMNCQGILQPFERETGDGIGAIGVFFP